MCIRRRWLNPLTGAGAMPAPVSIWRLGGNLRYCGKPVTPRRWVEPYDTASGPTSSSRRIDRRVVLTVDDCVVMVAIVFGNIGQSTQLSGCGRAEVRERYRKVTGRTISVQ